MATKYDKYEHTHVTINHPHGRVAQREGWDGTHEIVLHTGEFVWVAGNYAHAPHPDIRQVGDTRNNGYDEDGNCVLSVPASWCKFYTPEEANCIEECIHADEQLLSYAR